MFGTPYCFYSHFKWILSDQQKWYITWKNIQYEDHGTISNWLSFILLKGTKWFFQFNFDMFKMNLECKIYLCLGLCMLFKCETSKAVYTRARPLCPLSTRNRSMLPILYLLNVYFVYIVGLARVYTALDVSHLNSMHACGAAWFWTLLDVS
jgi:hypothetical protein